MANSVKSTGNLPNVQMAKKVFLQRVADNIKALATKKAPYDTGQLRRDLGTRVSKDYARIGTTASIPYARIQEFGGIITPKKAQYLHFKTKWWKWVKTKKVRIKPHPYLIPAGEEVINSEEYAGILVMELDKTTK